MSDQWTDQVSSCTYVVSFIDSTTVMNCVYASFIHDSVYEI